MREHSGVSSARTFVGRIVSGGQTGADRAALDAALELGIPHGGWAPLGRWAEDGEIDSRYRLRETPTPEPAVRTEWNVRDSDATVIFSHGPLNGGSALTEAMTRRYDRPVLSIDLEEADHDAALRRLREWLAEHRPATLNVAGPRASEDARIYPAVRAILLSAFAP
jgi:hypothetical protein